MTKCYIIVDEIEWEFSYNLHADRKRKPSLLDTKYDNGVMLCVWRDGSAMCIYQLLYPPYQNTSVTGVIAITVGVG